jgi:hypothetical protein
LDGYCPLLDLVGETEEATELSQVGHVSAVAAAPIFGDPFSSDKDPDDHLGVRVEASIRASIVDWYSIDGEEHWPTKKPAVKEAME